MSGTRKSLLRIHACQKDVRILVAENSKLVNELNRIHAENGRLKQVIIRTFDDEHRRMANDTSPPSRKNPHMTF